MSRSTLPPYVLQELPDITESVNYPLKNVQRVKYSCFDVSPSLIAFGATSGGIYVFNRWPCEFVQLIPNKDGTITRLAISTDERHIAFANGRGKVTITECKQSLSGGHFTTTSKEHQGNEVTCLVWNNSNTLFSSDDVGRVSVSQPQSFAKAMFSSSSQTIMSLDSRICQLDVRDCMLLVSTMTRSYICDTSQEQYRQIGQKSREGEFGACFVDLQKNVENGTKKPVQEFKETKKYNIVDEEVKFAVGKQFVNTLIYCARPSSRLWEASIDGTVKRTHQFKQVLARKPIKPVTVESYDQEKVSLEECTEESDGKSVNFSKIFSLGSAIFSFKRDALYFLDIQDENNTVWCDSYKDCIDCKIVHDNLYLWLSNGSLICLKFMKIDKFLLKCYLDEKYELCAELCALFSNYLLSNNLSSKLNILVGLREKTESHKDNIETVLDKLNYLKSKDATQMKTGIYVVENTFQAQTSFDKEHQKIEDSKVRAPSPDALLALKELSVTVSDKINTSKKILKEKWGDFEGKMKHHNGKSIEELNLPRPKREESEEIAIIDVNNDIKDIVFKESSQKDIVVDNDSLEEDRVCKLLYQYFRLSLVGKETDKSNLVATIENYACDINKIYNLMTKLEHYCLTIDALDESKFIPNNIFLSYITFVPHRAELLKSIIQDETLYKYFVDSCISVNMKTQKRSVIGCECGFPLPYARTNKTPVFSELIDEFIEKQWSGDYREQCYDMCKKMPFLWKKIMYLRKNEDLFNILRILLQILDENLLHSFLPQFTLDTWNKAIQLYATLHGNICLNCNRKFDNISVKETLSWDAIGEMIIKSVGSKNAIKIIEKHADLIEAGELTLKFYHTCLLVTLYEKYDKTITNQLTDALYTSYEFEESRVEIANLLRSTISGHPKNTALPLTIAAKTTHWGLQPYQDKIPQPDNEETEKYVVRNLTLKDTVASLQDIAQGLTDCALCGLPLQNEVLIEDGGLWVFKCGHVFHGACLELHRVKLCPAAH